MSGKSRLGMAVGGALATLALALPQAASGGVLDGVLGGVQESVNETVGGVLGGAGGGGSGGATGAVPAPAPAPAPTPAASGATTDPPITDDDPHAQGTVIDTDINNPVAPDLGVTVGESRGEQDASGNYHGVVRVISVTGLGSPVELAIETDEGESESGPLNAINDALDDLCTASDLCLNVLEYDSETTEKGSENSFSAASVDLLGGTVAADLVSSEGNISETDRCQSADSESSAAGVGVLTGTVAADVLAAESQSTACRGEGPDSTNDSTVATLNGTGLLAPVGCDEEQVDDEFSLPLLIDGVCNGDDTNGTQADAPYNVRKALGIDVLPAVLPLVGVGVDLDAGAAETLAVAPDAEEPECPDPNNPDCDGDPPECPDADNPACDEGDVSPESPSGSNGPSGPNGPNGPNGPSADDPNESLPFTGANLAVLGLIGGFIMAAGLGLMAYADKRRKAVV